MDFSKLKAYLDHLPDINIPGVDCAVYLDHKEVFRHSAGYADLEERKPVTPDTVYRMFSCTKIITCISALRLIEQGKLDLNEKLSHYLPAYENMMVKSGDTVRPARTPIRIFHLMSMSAGLDYNMNIPSVKAVMEKTNGHATTREIIDALAEKPLNFEPGTHYFYSLCHDVLVAVIEVCSGMKFSEYVDENIFKPLGITRSTFHPDEEYLKNLAARYEWHDGEPRDLRRMPEGGARRIMSDNYESGGGGLLSCLDDFIKVLDAVACGGEGWNGYRLLKPETIDIARKNWLCPEAEWEMSIDLQNRGYSYGLGFRTLQHPEHIGSRGIVGEFGWGGAAGAYAVMQPDCHFSICYLQHVTNCGYIFTSVQPTIRELTYEALGISGDKK